MPAWGASWPLTAPRGASLRATASCCIARAQSLLKNLDRQPPPPVYEGMSRCNYTRGLSRQAIQCAAESGSPETHMNKLSGLTIVGRLAGGFGLMMALLIANSGVGALGIQALFTNAHRAITNDVQLSQTASVIGQLILNERRFEKDVFINIGDAGARASYKKKWDAAKSALDERITSASKLDLA